jgi:hypothetical protein
MSFTIEMLKMGIKEFQPLPLGLYIHGNQELVLDPKIVSFKKYVDECPRQEERKSRRLEHKTVLKRYGFAATQVIEIDFDTLFVGEKYCMGSEKNIIVVGMVSEYRTIRFYDFEALIDWLKRRKLDVYRQYIQMIL